MADLLDNHPSELEADLWDQGIDLSSMFLGLVSVRRVAVITSQLPPGARVWQAGMSDAAWTTDQYLLAEQIDGQRIANWLASNRGVEKSKQSPQPDMLDRPRDIRAARAKEAREITKATKNVNLSATLAERRQQISEHRQEISNA